jgi:hypothetical protein
MITLAAHSRSIWCRQWFCKLDHLLLSADRIYALQIGIDDVDDLSPAQALEVTSRIIRVPFSAISFGTFYVPYGLGNSASVGSQCSDRNRQDLRRLCELSIRRRV